MVSISIVFLVTLFFADVLDRSVGTGINAKVLPGCVLCKHARVPLECSHHRRLRQKAKHNSGALSLRKYLAVCVLS